MRTLLLAILLPLLPLSVFAQFPSGGNTFPPNSGNSGGGTPGPIVLQLSGTFPTFTATSTPAVKTFSNGNQLVLNSIALPGCNGTQYPTIAINGSSPFQIVSISGVTVQYPTARDCGGSSPNLYGSATLTYLDGAFVIGVTSLANPVASSTCPNPVQLNVSGAFGADPSFCDYTAGIADPSVAPSVVATCTGTCATSYQYVIIETNGIGVTLDSPTSTAVMNAVSLDSMHYNTITLPTVADPNVYCLAALITPGGEGFILPYAVGTPAYGPCNGGTVADQGTGNTVMANPPVSANSTVGVLLPNGVGFSSAGIYTSFTQWRGDGSPINVGCGQQLMVQVNPLGGVLNPQFYSLPDCSGYWVSGGTSGASSFWQNLTTVTSNNSSSGTPFAGSQAFGVNKCYTGPGSGAAYYNMPPVASFPMQPMALFVYIHMPSGAAPCTITTPDGTLFDNGATSIVLTQVGTTACFYWDSNTIDGLTPIWASCGREPYAGSGMLGGNALLAGACDTPITMTITGAVSGMGVTSTPRGSPGAGSFVQAWISSANTVTAQVCESVAGTPTSRTYDFRVIQ